jgi:cyclopropane-fatty-acyl-phospholipid synthase
MMFASFVRRVLEWGKLTIVDAYGRRHENRGRDGPEVTVRLHDRALHHRLAINPHLHLGEAYMEGTLTIEQGTLFDFLDICTSNQGTFLAKSWLGRTTKRLDLLLRRLHQYNPAKRAQANVAHHYGLSDTLYELFLDGDLQYSCGYFTHPHDDIDKAQRDKKRHLAAKMLLRPGQRVLDIGSGWGGLALFLCESADCDVLGITLSREQLQVSEARARQTGRSGRVCFELKDYRDQTGSFDRIVSVGMFEHVGVNHYDAFFGKVRDLLADDGLAILHSIGRMDGPGSTNAWFRKYIFPGAYAPALSEVVPAIERAGLWITDIEILRLHYAETLRCWRRRFQDNHARVAKLYDERFCRMWEFYLTGAELMFRRLGGMVFQIQMAKRWDGVPLTRDYITDWERAQTA